MKLKIKERDLAKRCNVDYKTIYNWKRSKRRQVLYELLLKGYAYELMQEMQNIIDGEVADLAKLITKEPVESDGVSDETSEEVE